MDSQPPQQSDALAEGRRIYVGNLLYSVTPTDIETLLKETGLDQYEKIHISIDPISGRNPGYCFVEFFSREEAERALSTLEGVAVYDRLLKVGPCHPKSSSRDSRRQDAPTSRTNPERTFQRWGDWSGERRPAKQPVEEQGPYGALEHLREMRTTRFQDGSRLYVGGLGQMVDQAQNDQELRELFAGYEIVAIGKRITPHPSTREKPGNHHYCFIDFGSAEEAERARRATSGKNFQGSSLRVFPARGKPPGKEDAEDGADAPPQRPSERRAFQPSSPAGRVRAEVAGPGREERDGRQKIIMAASSWRTGATPVTE